VGLACLALGVEAVEFLFEALLARLAGIDGAAHLAGRGLGHRTLPCFRKPKNKGPFQRVPVMARAIADSDLYLRPSYSKPSVITVTWCSMPCHSRIRRVPATGRSFDTPFRRLPLGASPSIRASRSSRTSCGRPP